MRPVAVPDGLRRALAGLPEASDWLESVPDAVRAAGERWSLTLDLPDAAPAWHGNCALVVPVRCDDGTPAVLKSTWPHPEATHEGLALSTWAGRGAVRLLATDGAWTHLLERLDPGRDLLREPIDEAVGVVGDLLAVLHRAPAPGVLTPLSHQLERLVERWQHLAAPGPLPRRLLERALGLARDLLREPRDGSLLHCDLHFTNVLAGGREPWLAIDPKPYSGDPAYEVAPLLWNRFSEVVDSARPGDALQRRLDLVCERAGIDVERARAWSLVREVQNVLWAHETAQADELATHLALAELLSR